jgi:hypothetical protein
MKHHGLKPVIPFVLLLTALSNSGCAPNLPNKSFVQHDPAYNQAMPAVDRMGLFVDAAVAFDGMGGRFFDIKDSRTAMVDLAQNAQADLQAKGYEVAFVETPFVAGFLEGPPVPAAADRDTDPRPMPAPFQTEDYINKDPAYRDALETTSRQVIKAVQSHDKPANDTLQSDPAAKAALAILAEKKHIRYLFVVQGNGVIVSGAKQTGQVVGSAIIIGVLSLGTMSGSSHNVSFLDSYVSLIDLKTAEVIWSNTFRIPNFNPADADDYQHLQWAHQVLHWLPPRGSLEPTPPK